MSDVARSEYFRAEAFAAPDADETAEQKSWMAVGFVMGLSGVIDDLARYIKKNPEILPVMKPFFQQLLMLAVVSGAASEKDVMPKDEQHLSDLLNRFQSEVN